MVIPGTWYTERLDLSAFHSYKVAQKTWINKKNKPKTNHKTINKQTNKQTPNRKTKPNPKPEEKINNYDYLWNLWNHADSQLRNKEQPGNFKYAF